MNRKLDTEMDEDLFFESVKQHRGEYYVEYSPPQPSYSFATLNLVFPDTINLERVAEYMDRELRCWLARYPIPLMVAAIDVNHNLIQPHDDSDHGFLVGWNLSDKGEVFTSWNLSDLSEFTARSKQKLDWRKVFSDIPYRTQRQVKIDAYRNAKLRGRQVLSLKVVLLLWLAVIPAGIAIFLHFGPEWVALCALIYSLWKAFRCGTRIWGNSQQTPSKIEKSEKERKMRHYYYHCERNPEGFMRLRSQNLAKDTRQETRQEAARLSKLAI